MFPPSRILDVSSEEDGGGGPVVTARSSKGLLLRLFCNYYGHIGLHTEHFDRRRWPIMVVFAWNTAVLATVFYAFLSNESKRWMNYDTDRMVNLFLKIFYLTYENEFETVFMLVSLYWIFKGPDMIQLLANDHLTQAYDFDQRTSCLIFLVAILFINGTYVMFYWSLFTWSNVLNGRLTSYYIQYSHHFIFSLVVFYVKYSTRKQILDGFRRFQLDPYNLENDRYLIEKIQSLAHLNHRINVQYAWIYFLHFVCDVIDVIAVIVNSPADSSGLIVDGPYFFYLTLMHSYQVDLTESVPRILRRIPKVLDDSDFEKRLKQYKYRKLFLKLYEIDIYGEYFHLNLFNVCYFDSRFLLDTICFISTYCILVIQTQSGYVVHRNPQDI